MTTPRISEAALQQQGVAQLRALGAKVYVLGTRRSRRDSHMGTRQTPGIPDVLAFLPELYPSIDESARTRVQLWWEVKATGGRLRPDQAQFQWLCRGAGQAHVVGGLDALLAWLVDHEYLTWESLPHYRRPA